MGLSRSKGCKVTSFQSWRFEKKICYLGSNSKCDGSPGLSPWRWAHLQNLTDLICIFVTHEAYLTTLYGNIFWYHYFLGGWIQDAQCDDLLKSAYQNPQTFEQVHLYKSVKSKGCEIEIHETSLKACIFCRRKFQTSCQLLLVFVGWNSLFWLKTK